MDPDKVELGGSISLSGFNKVERPVMTVLKKIVGNYVRKINDKSENFQGLNLNLKLVHEREKSEIYEIHAKMIENGNPVVSSATDRNLFVAIDSALKRIDKEISR